MRSMLPADELAKVDEIQSAIQYVSETVASGKAVIQAELAINALEFDALVRTEAATTAVWLNKMGDRTVAWCQRKARTASRAALQLPVK